MVVHGRHKHLIAILLTVVCVGGVLTTVPPAIGNHDPYVRDFRMPGVMPTRDDEYICTAKKVDHEQAFIVQYEVDSANNKAHHVLLFGCGDVDPKNLERGHWRCDDGNICQNMKIMFAWAKNAPPTKLPKDVGFRIGGSSGVNYLVLEIHYAHPLTEKDSSGILLHMTNEEQKYIAGIFLLLSQAARIPRNQAKVHADINCAFRSKAPIYPFAYRVHAHSLGVVISGYKYDPTEQKWTQLGKGNPQWPQAFYPMDKVYKVENSEILAARCTFNSTGRNRYTYIGSTAADEMCNFYIMYYTDAQKGSPFGECVDMQYPGLVDVLPVDSDVPLPRNALLEEHAHGGRMGQKQTTVVNTPLTNGAPHRGVVHHGSNEATGNTLNPEGKGLKSGSDHGRKISSSFTDVSNWPVLNREIGQVTAVALDSANKVVIFHRGARIWDGRSFDVQNRFTGEKEGPITDNTILTLDPKSGNVIHQWGRSLFYMPHGLTLDASDNVWVTDVALHQVMKFAPRGGDKPLMVLGTPLQPGSDENHFCKPSSVAVAKSGEFYVADGYCNNRILKYSPAGKLLLQWGQATGRMLGFLKGVPPPYAFDVPHKIVLAEDKQLACVADRENGRIQCFTMSNGTFHCEIGPPEFGHRLFSIAYSPAEGGLLYAVNGPSFYGSSDVQGFVVNLTTRSTVGLIRPSKESLSNPHDVAVSADGSIVYIAEIGPNKLWKFVSNKIISTTSAPTTVPVANPSDPAESGVKQSRKQSDDPGENKAVKEGEDVHIDSVVSTTSNLGLTLIIVALLAIPVLLTIAIAVMLRMRKQGHSTSRTNGYKQQNKNDRFNLGNFLHPHKGFDRISMEESDGELENSDSEVEEYAVSSAQKA